MSGETQTGGGLLAPGSRTPWGTGLEPASQSAQELADTLPALLGGLVLLAGLWALVLKLRAASPKRWAVVGLWGTLVLGAVAWCAALIWTGRGIEQVLREELAPTPRLQLSVTLGNRGLRVLYPKGLSSPELRLPLGEAVLLRFSSERGPYQLQLPELGRQVTVFPGHTEVLPVVASRLGALTVSCLRGCSARPGSSVVPARVETPQEFENWQEPSLDPVALGARVFQNNACGACHSVDGSKLTGPSLLGAWGQLRGLADGSQVLVDSAYVRRSIFEPQAQLVANYSPTMPSYRGRLKPPEVEQLLAYLESLQSPKVKERGADLPSPGDLGKAAEGR